VKGIRVYVEGGGQHRAGRDALRRGFGSFLEGLREAARRKRVRWNVVACGSRDDAFEDFTTARSVYPDDFVLLLVDSEGPVTGSVRSHLAGRDGWALSTNDEDRLHIMVQQMESWLVSDPLGLQKFYGRGFRPDALPARPNVEDVPRNEVVRALERATADTKKGRYSKRHGLEAMGVVQAGPIRARAPHCERLFVTVKEAIDAL
jgi:Domain of unknown function (DUF4276)